MKKIKILIIFLIFGCFSLNAQTDSILLEQAYQKKSVEMLDQFFMNWHKTVPSVTNEELAQMNDTIRSAYEIFKCFYSPLDIKRTGGSEWGNDIYKNVKYFIIPNKIKIYISDEKLYYTEDEKAEYLINWVNERYKDKDSTRQRMLETIEQGRFKSTFGVTKIKTELIDSITNFRPQIDYNEKISIYLTPHYENILNNFLGDSHYPLGTGNIMNPARSEGESMQRQKFLENYIRILYGHWGGYWHLNTFPEVYKIVFNRDMKSALIDFRMNYQGGEACLIKENGEWKLMYSQLIWIE